MKKFLIRTRNQLVYQMMYIVIRPFFGKDWENVVIEKIGARLERKGYHGS